MGSFRRIERYPGQKARKHCAGQQRWVSSGIDRVNRIVYGWPGGDATEGESDTSPVYRLLWRIGGRSFWRLRL